MPPYFESGSRWFEFVTKELNIELAAADFELTCPEVAVCVDCCGRCLEMSHQLSICKEILKRCAERRKRPPALLGQICAELDAQDSSPPPA